MTLVTFTHECLLTTITNFLASDVTNPFLQDASHVRVLLLNLFAQVGYSRIPTVKQQLSLSASAFVRHYLPVDPELLPNLLDYLRVDVSGAVSAVFSRKPCLMLQCNLSRPQCLNLTHDVAFQHVTEHPEDRPE